MRTVSEYVEKVARLKGTKRQYFRGHNKTRYKLEPSVFRTDRQLADAEQDILRDLVAFSPIEFLGMNTWLERLVHAQHHGLPTRLLDVTSSPLVALYFAVDDALSKDFGDGHVTVITVDQQRIKAFDSDTMSCVANLSRLTASERKEISSWIRAAKANGKKASALPVGEFNKLASVKRLVHFIQEEKPHFKPRIRPIDLLSFFLVQPTLSSPRISAQAGAFLASGVLPKFGRSQRVQTEKMVVPASAKRAILGDLDALGINRRTLFPDIQNAALYIADIRSKL